MGLGYCAFSSYFWRILRRKYVPVGHRKARHTPRDSGYCRRQLSPLGRDGAGQYAYVGASILSEFAKANRRDKIRRAFSLFLGWNAMIFGHLRAIVRHFPVFWDLSRDNTSWDPWEWNIRYSNSDQNSWSNPH